MENKQLDKIIDLGGELYDINAVHADSATSADTVDGMHADEFAKKANGIYYVVGTGTTAGTWTGICDDITEYYDGLTIAYKVNIAGASTTTLNINGLGAKTMYLRGTTKLGTQYGVDTVIIAIYTTVSGTGRWYVNDYDANTNTYQRLYSSTSNVEYPITTRYNTTTGETYYAEYGRYSTGVTLNPSTNTITATTFKGDLTGNAATATYADGAGYADEAASAETATKLGTADVGSATQPIYLDNGVPKATTYTLGKSVPSDAKFTDTTYGTATSDKDGLMSATDKDNLDTIVNSFANDDSDTTIDTIKEVLKAFENAPEGTNIANALAGKSDKTHTHPVSTTTASVVKTINGGSGSFTPTTKYLHHSHTAASLGSPSTDTFVKFVSFSNGILTLETGTAITGYPSFSGGSSSLTSNTTASGGIKYFESATHTHTGASVASNETVLTGVTVKAQE